MDKTEQSRFERESNRLYRILNTDQGLDGIILTAEEIMGRAVALLDPGYTMLSVSPMILKLPFGVESGGDGKFLSPGEVESLRRLQIENQIYQSSRAFFVETEDHPETNWIFCAIRIQRVMSGYVAVCLDAGEEATEYDLALASVIADVCAVEIQKEGFSVKRTGAQYETFLADLIEGRFNSPGVIESRFRVLGRPLGKYFCLVILHCAEPTGSEVLGDRQMSALRKHYPGSLSVVYKNNIVLLLNQDMPILLKDEFTEPLREFALHNQLTVSFSQPFADILKIKIFYEQAIHTLELAESAEPGQSLFFSTKALPDYLFSKCDYAELETGIHYHIFQLADYDREYHTEYIPTLRAYLDHGRNAAKTSEYLHVHRTTLFYRMKKIEELLDVDLTDGELLFLYELSFRIWDYLSR